MKIVSSVLLSLLLSQSLLANPTFEQFLKGEKASQPSSTGFTVSCEFSIDGCNSNDDYMIGDYQRYLDNLYACQSSYYGCSEDEQKKIDFHEISKRGMTSSQFGDLLNRYDPRLEHKGYFIPLGLSDKELIAFAAATSLGLVIFANDQEVMDFVQDHKTEQTQTVANVGNLFGSTLIPPVAIGAYFLGAVFQDGQLKQLGLLTVAAGLATQTVTEAFKKTFNRVRPNGYEGPYAFGHKGNKSFFSGHTAAAWSFATVISEVYKEDHQWVPYVAYGLAAVTAYARMHDEKHWMTDVLAGAVMGHLITKAVIRTFNNDDTYGGVEVYPSYDSSTGTYTINIFYSPKRPKETLRCATLPDGEFKIKACIAEAFAKSR